MAESDEGFRFLGFDFWKDYLILPDVKMKRYKDKVRKITRRQQGKNLDGMIKKLNEVVRGFGNYFGIGNVKAKFQRLDEWTRTRVRSFMRKKRSEVSKLRIPNKKLEKAGMVAKSVNG